MSEHSNTTSLGDDQGLTDADIDRAYATSVERGGRLVRRRNQRRAAVSGLGIAILLIGGFGVLRTLSDDGSDVVVAPASDGGNQVLAPATSTTTTPPVPTTTIPPDAPFGFTRTELAGGVSMISNDTPPDMGTGAPPAGGVEIGTAATETRSATVGPVQAATPTSITVELPCEPPLNHLNSVKFRLDGSVVTVQASMVAAAGEPACNPAAPTLVELTFPAGDVPADVTAVAGLLDE